ncbi:MAG: hypothetical protein LBJ96_01970 [Holosporaceae bacterium]|jgi:hypothetical protein|nr:hypothetical protein [Holosporaceae bacterium]
MRKILLCLSILCLVQVFEMSSTAAEVNAVPPIYDPARNSAARGPGTIKPLAQRFFDEIVQYKDQINGIWEKITNVNSDGNHYNELVENYRSLADIFSNKLKPQLSGLILASEHVEVFMKARPEVKGIPEAQRKLNECLALYYDIAKMINVIANDLGISEEKFLQTAKNGGDFKAAAPGVLWSVADFEAGREQINKENFILDYRCNAALICHLGGGYLDYRSGGRVGKYPGMSALIDYEKQKEASVMNGRLVSGLGRIGQDGSSMDTVTYPFPVSRYLLGRFDTEMPFYETPLSGGNKGWKVHVSATLVSAEKVIGVVIPYLLHHGVSFKVMTTAPAMRRSYAESRYKEKEVVSQFGKFITIYPSSVDWSTKIVEDLDQILNNRGYRDGDFVIPVPVDEKKFVGSDFVTCTGDLTVHSKCDGGISGALSVRYVNSYTKDYVPGTSYTDEGTNKSRRIPVIDEDQFKDAFPGGRNPFFARGFTLSYHGVNLPGPNPELVDLLRSSYVVAEKSVLPKEGELETEALQISLKAAGFLSSIASVGNSPVMLMQRTLRPSIPRP